MMTSNSNANGIDKVIETSDYTQTDNPYELSTSSAIEDDLTFRLSSKCEYQIDWEKVIHINRKYIDYAEHFLYRINIFKPVPKFDISWADVPQKLQEHLINMDKKTVNNIMTNVVRRILESIDPVYFHTNGIYGKIKWRFSD